jgi:hypothetical protein
MCVSERSSVWLECVWVVRVCVERVRMQLGERCVMWNDLTSAVGMAHTGVATHSHRLSRSIHFPYSI